MTNPTKQCSKCGEEKSFDNYSPHPRGRHGLQARCKACGAAANTARYHANIEVERERARVRSAAYSAANPEKVREAKRRWASGNREKDNASKRKWDRKNPEAKAAANQKWVEENRDRHNEKGKAWKKHNPDAMRVYHLRKYGLTPESFAAMLAAQEGRCAICDSSFDSRRAPCIDHCHNSTKVRALLCVKCNAAIGQFMDRPERMESAARYIRKHNGVLG